jgi:hypothetical protein
MKYCKDCLNSLLVSNGSDWLSLFKKMRSSIVVYFGIFLPWHPVKCEFTHSKSNVLLIMHVYTLRCLKELFITSLSLSIRILKSSSTPCTYTAPMFWPNWSINWPLAYCSDILTNFYQSAKEKLANQSRDVKCNKPENSY